MKLTLTHDQIALLKLTLEDQQDGLVRLVNDVNAKTTDDLDATRRAAIYQIGHILDALRLAK